MHYYDDDDEPQWDDIDRRPDDDDDDSLIDGVGFARSGSALRCATASNPRNLPCPNCGGENLLTEIDRMRGYQCDNCADRAERGTDY